MLFFDTLFNLLGKIKQKKFYWYSLLYISIVILFISFIAFRFYQKKNSLNRKAQEINDLREEVLLIREKFQYVKMQRDSVNEMLDEDTDFKIAGYFDDLLSQLTLLDKQSKTETSQIDREDNYRETELFASLIDLTMKQLTELLQRIEQTRRIYIKKLEIMKSKKKGFIDTEIIIATLLPKEVS